MLKIYPPVIAHRGASAYAPENTMAAFEKAHALGIRWLEFDIMLSADNKAVIIHDETLDRTSNGFGLVSECTFDQLKLLDMGSWFHTRFSNQRISLLEEVITFLNEKNLYANFEIKSSPGKEIVTVKTILQDLKRFKGQALVSSFSLDVIYQVRKFSSDIPIGFLMDEWMPDWIGHCDALNCVSVHPNQDLLSQERILEIKATGRKILTYTVNDPHYAKKLFSLGVDAVFSDCPDQISALFIKNQ